MYINTVVLFILNLGFCYSDTTRITVNINTVTPIQNVGANFVSIGMEAGIFREKHKAKDHFKFRSKFMQTLAKGLAPCYVRLGGTTADYLTFSDENFEESTYLLWNQPHVRLERDTYKYMGKNLTNFTMTEAMWDETLQFMKTVGWDLIFDLNVLKRKDGKWDPTNALSLMKYSMNKGYKLAGWELGNEPNDFRKLVGYKVPPGTLAQDYIALKGIIENYFPNSLLLGPSTTQLSHKKAREYFTEFMETEALAAITSPTFHQYYINGRTATLEDFINPHILDDLAPEIELGNSILKQQSSKKKIWLGETSSAYGGGAPGLSDAYVAGFMWLDKLGVSAKLGVDVVVRQAFDGGNYALIDYDSLTPFPDYWLTLVYKNLVGGNVLNVTTDPVKGYIRMYAHCTNTKSGHYKPGSITLYGMNLMNTSVEIVLPKFHDHDLHLYLMEPDDDGLTSRNVKLNGVELRLTDTGNLPNIFIPKTTRSPFEIPAHTFMFLVVPSADVPACRKEMYKRSVIL